MEGKQKLKAGIPRDASSQLTIRRVTCGQDGLPNVTSTSCEGTETKVT